MTGRERRRRSAATLLLTLLAGVLLLGTAPTALAHDGLVSTIPASGSTVHTPPAAVELAFTAEPLPIGTVVLVTDADGAVLSEGEPEIRGTTVVQRLLADLPAGAYQVAWRSTSSDGHALTGTFGFTTAAGTPAAAPSEPVVPSPAAAGEDVATSEDVATGEDVAGGVGVAAAGAQGASGAGPVAGVWIAAGAIAVLGLGALLVSRQRRRG